MFKHLKPLALAAVATLALAGVAEAGIGGIKSASVDVAGSVMHNPTTLVFAPKDGKYEFKELTGGPVQVRMTADTSLRAWISRYQLRLNSWDGPTLADSGWGDLKKDKIDKTVSFKPTREMLKALESAGRKFCNAKGSPSKKVLEKKWVKMYSLIESGGKNIMQYPRFVQRYPSFPAYIACMPAPFEVNDVQLSVQYEGSSRDCPVNATLQAKFKTNKPEKKQFTFVLVRDNGMKQEVTKYAYPQGNGGVATWQKKYTFTKTEKRKYMIYVKGHKATAMWVPVGANCSSGPAGGFSNGALPTN